VLSRRRFLTLAGAGGAALALGGCGGPTPPRALILPTDAAVRAAEDRRRRPGAPVHDVTIVAAPLTADLGGLTVDTFAYNGAIPGPEIRVRAGDVLRARFENRLPEPTTIHWHGVRLRNDMDGVPGLTQPIVPAGGTFTYEFTVPDPGTFWFHPHVELQLDAGLYAPLVVEDPTELGYDRDYTLVLDDWTHGLGQDPAEIFDDLRHGRGAHAAHIAAAEAGGDPGARSKFLASPPGDVSYPMFTLNGLRPSAAPEFEARPGDRVRFRILNAGGDSPFRVAVGGHRMTVTHTDGFPVDPVTVDSLVVAMSERYDVVVNVAGSGAFPIVAVAEAKPGHALGVLRSGPGDPPPRDARPAELEGRVLRLDDLVAAQRVRLPAARPDKTYVLELGGGEEGYVWTINGRPHGDHDPLPVQEGERVRLVFTNRTTMFHPMHVHGHTFQVVNPAGRPGPRKDTTIVRPDTSVAVDFLADNPGQWMVHCHNIYHQAGGMMTVLSYVGERAAPGAGDERASALGLVCDWVVPGAPAT
jgi:FtsP/CotA-like multicopper oxidase with cupredoxin domain